MKAAAECSCSVCRAHRLHPQLPEHAQAVQLRELHAAHIRNRRLGRALGWGLAAILTVLGLLVVVRAMTG
jgi:hypothetical protein